MPTTLTPRQTQSPAAVSSERSSSPRRVALVVPALTESGGVATVGRFLYRVLQDAPDFQPEFVSVPLSSSDEASVRLTEPTTWLRGVQVDQDTWEGAPYRHVGAVGVELEFQRYRPRPDLTKLLNDYDLVQIVAGTPAWGLLAEPLQPPVTLQVATRARVERRRALEDGDGLRTLWRRVMAHITSRMEDRALSHADAVFVENAWMYDYVSRHLPDERVHFSPPGVDTYAFRPAGPEDRRPTLLDPITDDYILSVGRFADPRKNIELLMEAYGRLASRRDDVPHLVLVGRTPPPVEAWASVRDHGVARKVTFLEDVDAETLRALYRHAGIVALSSDEEGLGLVLLEAMASGVPVVSTDCGGPSTVVDDGVTGLLTPVGDAAAFADALASLVEHPERARQMGRAGRERAVNEFSLDAAGGRFLEIYRELVGE